MLRSAMGPSLREDRDARARPPGTPPRGKADRGTLSYRPGRRCGGHGGSDADGEEKEPEVRAVALHGGAEYVRRVVRTGIDVDHVNDLGWTALLEAVILGDGGPRHQEVVRILLDAGADRGIADKDGVTALEHAERRGYEEIARLLRRGNR